MNSTFTTPSSTKPDVRLGVVTIGQTPRTDLTPELARHLPGAEIVERGALDGLSAAQIHELAPQAGEHVLTTRLRDGGSAVIGEGAVINRLPAVIQELEADVDAILLACTGPFPGIDHRRPLFVPDRIIAHAVGAAATAGEPVGIIAPLPEQVEDTTRKFDAVLRGMSAVHVAACSPYTGTTSELRRAGRSLAEDGARLLAMDCFGYTADMRRIVAEETGLPVIVARSIAARLAAEALGLEGTTNS
jgi:protein AroM